MASILLSYSFKVLLTLSYFSLLPQNYNNKKKWGGDGFYSEDRGCPKVMWLVTGEQVVELESQGWGSGPQVEGSTWSQLATRLINPRHRVENLQLFHGESWSYVRVGKNGEGSAGRAGMYRRGQWTQGRYQGCSCPLSLFVVWWSHSVGTRPFQPRVQPRLKQKEPRASGYVTWRSSPGSWMGSAGVRPGLWRPTELGTVLRAAFQLCVALR